MYGSLEISTSGMVAQRTRLEVIASNIANRDAILDSDGNMSPYRRRIAEFAAGDLGKGRGGVRVASITEDPTPFNMRFDPSHPYAMRSGPNQGYVLESNVDVVTEQINALEAARAYEANVAAAEATKAMTAQALRLLA